MADVNSDYVPNVRGFPTIDVQAAKDLLQLTPAVVQALMTTHNISEDTLFAQILKKGKDKNKLIIDHLVKKAQWLPEDSSNYKQLSVVLQSKGALHFLTNPSSVLMPGGQGGGKGEGPSAKNTATGGKGDGPVNKTEDDPGTKLLAWVNSGAPSAPVWTPAAAPTPASTSAATAPVWTSTEPKKEVPLTPEEQISRANLMWRVRTDALEFKDAIVRAKVEMSSAETRRLLPGDTCVQRGAMVRVDPGVVRMPIEPDGWVTVHARIIGGPTFLELVPEEQVAWIEADKKEAEDKARWEVLIKAKEDEIAKYKKEAEEVFIKNTEKLAKLGNLWSDSDREQYADFLTVKEGGDGITLDWTERRYPRDFLISFMFQKEPLGQYHPCKPLKTLGAADIKKALYKERDDGRKGDRQTWEPNAEDRARREKRREDR